MVNGEFPGSARKRRLIVRFVRPLDARLETLKRYPNDCVTQQMERQ
jgi:hypothetical protein